MDLPAFIPAFPIVEVRFKGGRKEFCRNENGLDLVIGDAVQIDTGNGLHIGRVALTGELVRLQLKRKNTKAESPEIRNIVRLATQRELEKHQELANRELPILYRARHIIEALSLNMKLSDVEFQADGARVSFFYSAEERVDFRDLIKLLATEFKTRVDMRQISLRQEAARLGGIGACGRELCCSTWLTDFKSVTTSAARYQNLSLNPTKLSGQCGRLKCCLNYELETYMDALKHIPKVEKFIRTEKGDAFLQKTDIFRRIMWFGYKGETSWHALPAERVAKLLAMSKAGEKIVALTEEEERIILYKDSDHQGPLNEDIAALDKKLADQRRKDREKQMQRMKERQAQKRRPEAVSAAAPQAKAADVATADEAGKPKAKRRWRGGR